MITVTDIFAGAGGSTTGMAQVDGVIVDLFAGPGGAPDECWEGAGSDNGNGYRTVRVNGRNVYLHRLSYEAARGPIPEASVIDHLCRNRIKQRMCRECGRERLRRRRAAAKEVMPNG